MSLFGGQLQLDFDISGSVTSTDSLLYLSCSNPADTIDIGWYGSYISSGLKYAGMFRDASDGAFKLFKDMTSPPTNNVVAAVSSFADLSVNTIIVNAGTASQYLALDSNKKIISVPSSGVISDAHIRGLFSESDANLTYDNSTGVFGFASSPTFTNETLTGALQCKGLATIGYDFGVSGGVKISTATYGKPTVEALTSALAADTLYLNPAGGSIGVGTNTPTALFDVAGFIRSTNTTSTPTSGKGVEIIYHTGADTGYVQAYDRSTSAYKPLIIDASTLSLNSTSAGRVGIGVFPSFPLHVKNTSSPQIVIDDNSGGTAELRQYNSGVITSTYFTNSSGSNLRSVTAIPLYLGTSNTTQMTILASGYVGIGSTVPNKTLDVNGDIRQSWGSGIRTNYTEFFGDGGGNYFGGLQYDMDNRVLYVNSKSNDTNGAIAFKTGVGAGYATAMYVNPLGNIGISTIAPDRRLTVQGVGASRDPMLYLKQTNDYGYSFNLDSSSSGRLSIVGVNNGTETAAILSLDRTTAALGLGAAPTTTGGYPTRLDIHNGGIGPSLKLQDSAGSGRAHIQLGSHATSSNNVHIGTEGNGAFYAWNGTFGGGTEMMQVTSTQMAIGSGVGSNALQIRGNDANGGSSVNILNSSKTGGNSNSWSIYNMGSFYGNGLQFWYYPVSGGAYRSLQLADTGHVYIDRGNLQVYGTISSQNATPTLASFTCSNASVGAPTAYANYRLLMYDSGTATASYGIGIESTTLWYSSNQNHKWYANGSQTMLLDKAGSLTLAGYRVVPFTCAAEIYQSGSTTQACTLVGAKLTIFDSTGISKNATPSAASDNITITVAGTYQVTFRFLYFNR